MVRSVEIRPLTIGATRGPMTGMEASWDVMEETVVMTVASAPEMSADGSVGRVEEGIRPEPMGRAPVAEEIC